MYPAAGGEMPGAPDADFRQFHDILQLCREAVRSPRKRAVSLNRRKSGGRDGSFWNKAGLVPLI